MNTKLLRAIRPRILLVGMVCGLLGVLSILIGMGWTSQRLMLRYTVPVIEWILVHGELTRCERDPASWRLEGPGGAQLWAYDSTTLRSRNPAAPPLPPKLGMALAQSQSVLRQDGLGRGGLVAVRLAARSPCGIVAAELRPLIDRSGALWFFVLGGLVAASIGGTIAALASARPLRELQAAQSALEATAQALARSRDELQQQIADVAHDVRTPIASLQLAIEQALSATQSGAQRDEVETCLQRAVTDVVYVGALIGNLRLASELRSGVDPTRGTTDLCEVVEHAALRARFVARQKRCALEIAVPDQPIRVDGNPIAIAQAVSNVLDNSVTYTDAGGHVAVVLEAHGERGFQLTVVDDGPGVASADLPRLGARTFRSDEARKRDARGSGLGLAITSEVCRRLGWLLTFAHEEPRGLRVRMRGCTHERFS